MEFINSLNNYGPIITFIFTLALIIITAYYARQTYRMNKILKESSEYERRPNIYIFCEYDKLHQPSFGVSNDGPNVGEDITIFGSAIIGVSRYLEGLESYKDKIILEKIFDPISINLLIPGEDSRTGWFQDILESLVKSGYISICPGDEYCYWVDGYGEKSYVPIEMN